MKFSRKRNYTINNIAQLTYQLITIIVGFYITRFIIINFGSDLNGLMASINQVLNYFGLVEAGISGSVTYALYRPLFKKDVESINNLLSISKRYFSKSSFIFFGLTTGYIIVTMILENRSILNISELISFIIILALPVLLRIYFISKYDAIFKADKKEYFLSFSSSIYILTNSIIIVFFTLYGFNLLEIKLIALIATIFQITILTILFKKNYRQFHFNSSNTLEKIVNKNDVMWNQILTGLLNGLPIFIGSIILDFKLVSVISIYLVLIHSLSGFITIISNNLVPHFGELLIANQKEVLKRIYLQYEYYYFIILNLTYGCVIMLIKPFISIYTKGINDINYLQIELINLCIIYGILNLLKSTRGTIMHSDGKFRVTKYHLIVQLGIGIFFSLILTIKLGASGLFYGMIAAHLLRDYLIFIYTGNKYSFINSKKSLKYLFISFILFFTCFIYESFYPLEIQSYRELIQNAFLVAIIICLVVIMIFEITNGLFIFKKLKEVSLKKWKNEFN